MLVSFFIFSRCQLMPDAEDGILGCLGPQVCLVWLPVDNSQARLAKMAVIGHKLPVT